VNDMYVNEYAVDACPAEGDAALAVEYLNAAMEDLGYDDISRLPQLTYITFERDDMKLLGETIVDTWKQVLGLNNITFVQYPIGTAIQQFYTGEYDLFMISIGCSVSAIDIMDSFVPDGAYGFFTAEWETDMTGYVDSVNACEFQSDEYFTKVAEMETVFLNEYAVVPLYNQTFYYVLADGVEGYVEPGISFNYQINHLSLTK